MCHERIKTGESWKNYWNGKNKKYFASCYQHIIRNISSIFESMFDLDFLSSQNKDPVSILEQLQNKT